MNKLIWWGVAIVGACLLDVITSVEPEPPKKSKREPRTRIRLQKSLRGKGNYDGPGCWKRGEGFVG